MIALFMIARKGGEALCLEFPSGNRRPLIPEASFQSSSIPLHKSVI